MDFLTRHWGAFPRRHPAAFPLISIDRLPQKRDWVSRRFDTCNFSLILRGRGEYRWRGRIWQVQAPCVLVECPGESPAYGPLPGESWDELYLVYERKMLRKFQAARLLDPEIPVWPMADPASLKIHVAELTQLARHPLPATVVDRVDRCAERLILETWLGPRGGDPAAGEMLAIAAGLRERMTDPLAIGELGSRHGCSPSTFRRRWQDAIGMPPARYLQELRICEACRMLVETTLPISAIARQVGYDDEFYFSRRFRQAMGMPPRAYRQTYRLEPAAG